MAGGMTRGGWDGHGSGTPLADRVRAGADGPRDGAPSPARHCWVADTADGRGYQRPGLLVEWRQSEVGWEGRVLYSARLREVATSARDWAVVEEWLPADRLTPL